MITSRVHLALALSAVIAVAGCKPAETAKPTTAPAQTAPAQTPTQVQTDPVPTQSAVDTFKGCQWGKVEGARMEVWSFKCGPDMGSTALVYDETDGPIFAITSDGGEPQMVIKSFTKAADAPIESILAAVRAASPGPHTDTCVLAPWPAAGSAPYANPAHPLYIFQPTGAAKVQWDRMDSGHGGAGDEGMDAPCGDLGVQMSGDHTFNILPGDPTQVVYVDNGSEIQIFDSTTLKARS
ncbi:hypothetical protein BH10PSE2_BH10PSE2_06470 [soil metagenome]